MTGYSGTPLVKKYGGCDSVDHFAEFEFEVSLNEQRQIDEELWP